MTGNHITEIMGIVNGTTNYILTKMTESGMDYKEALAKATELGYAEADPTADVEGYDAGRKIAIMASIAFNSRVTFADVYTEGITKISADDIKYAKEFGYVIKLLGVAKNTEDGIESTPRNGEEFMEAKSHFLDHYDGGETMMHLCQRVYNLLDDVKAESDHKTYLLVAHNGISRIVQSYFYDMTNEEFAHFGIKNCEIREYNF